MNTKEEIINSTNKNQEVNNMKKVTTKEDISNLTNENQEENVMTINKDIGTYNIEDFNFGNAEDFVSFADNKEGMKFSLIIADEDSSKTNVAQFEEKLLHTDNEILLANYLLHAHFEDEDSAMIIIIKDDKYAAKFISGCSEYYIEYKHYPATLMKEVCEEYGIDNVAFLIEREYQAYDFLYR